MGFLRKINEFYHNGDFFTNATDGFIYLGVYWFIPVATLWCEYISTATPERLIAPIASMNFSCVLITTAVGGLSDCYSRWQNVKCASNTKVFTVGILNFCLLVYSAFSLVNTIQNNQSGFFWIIYPYVILLTVFVFSELLKKLLTNMAYRGFDNKADG